MLWPGAGEPEWAEQIRKQYLMLDNLPVLVRTMDVFDRHPDMACTVVVVPEKDMDLCRTQIIQPRKFFHPVYLTPGGSHRQHSVRNGVQKALVLADDPQQTLVLIHDGVRPFVSGKLLDQLTHTAIHSGGCIPVLPVTDTLKQVDDQNRIIATVDRKGLFQAQTPRCSAWTGYPGPWNMRRPPDLSVRTTHR